MDQSMTGRLAEYARLADSIRSMRDGITDVRGSASSDDGLVSAVVGGRGELLELELDPRIYREQDVITLAETIVATVAEAAAESEREAARFAAQLMPRHQGDVDPVFGPVLHLLDERARR
ncbi:YbaB/EbfC family nucleoid-associated protein [Actinosynnema sp. NPDC051121]